MIEDAEKAQRFIGAMSEREFKDDERTIFAVCYCFVRLGEAASKIPDEVKLRHPHVEWREMRHFRNFMVHVYLSVDPGKLYETAKTDLPRLVESLRGISSGDDVIS
jgi:uncharacterized protein with HEPN domain